MTEKQPKGVLARTREVLQQRPGLHQAAELGGIMPESRLAFRARDGYEAYAIATALSVGYVCHRADEAKGGTVDYGMMGDMREPLLEPAKLSWDEEKKEARVAFPLEESLFQPRSLLMALGEQLGAMERKLFAPGNPERFPLTLHVPGIADGLKATVIPFADKNQARAHGRLCAALATSHGIEDATIITVTDRFSIPEAFNHYTKGQEIPSALMVESHLLGRLALLERQTERSHGV